MIGALMRLPWEAVASRMLRALHANGFDDIDAPQLSVLLWPGPEGLRPSELATRTRMTKQALNYLLGNLQRLGYLERRPDPGDRRARRIALAHRDGVLCDPAAGDHPHPQQLLQLFIVPSHPRGDEQGLPFALGDDRFGQLRELLVELNDVVAREAAANA